ncbi:MAG: hypothetical protein ACI97A_000051 [Planctomycetota bacterium]|jgi:hypothetical protein
MSEPWLVYWPNRFVDWRSKMSHLLKLAPLLLVVGLVVLLSSSRNETIPLPEEIAIGITSDWMRDGIWDDGNAEYSVYDAEWRRYGRLNKGRVCMLIVKEPWQAKLDTKSEGGQPADFDVLKLNVIRDINTGVYTYEQMASVFARRDTGALRKYVTGSLEACGQTSTMLMKGQLSTRSYWGDQGNRDQNWPANAIPEDALPLYLRGLMTGELPTSISVFPSLMAGRLPRLEPTTFSVERKLDVTVKTAAGTFNTVSFTLSYGRENRVFQFDSTAKGRTLVRFRHSNGTEYTLAKTERMPYWQMNGPADEAWWPKRLR